MSPSAGRAYRVLVIDDEPSLTRALEINLRAAGWDVETANDGRSGLAAVASRTPDVVVLDLGLPDIDGTEVLVGIRGWSAVPVVVLSARQHGEEKVEALDLGADDYVTKPFAMNELLARLRAAVRRSTPPAPGSTSGAGSAQAGAIVDLGDLSIDLGRKKVSKHGTEISLTPTEWAFLELLVQRRGLLVSREEILREVWGPSSARQHHYLRVYAAQLRRKLEDDPSHPDHLITTPGFGYTLG